jgi:hypothetical protein
MTLYNARFIIGLTVLVAHFCAVIIYLTLGASLLPRPVSDVTQGVLTIAPIFGMYGLMFVKYVTAEANIHAQDRSSALGVDVFIVQYFVVFLFCFLLISGQIYILLFWSSVEDVKIFTASIETAFGLMVGRIFERLFPAKLFQAEASS